MSFFIQKNCILKENISHICYKYISEAGFSINYNTLKLQLLSHQNYPSFKSIIDSFDYFGIENIAVNVPTDVYDQLPDNFLCVMVYRDKRHIVHVKKYKNNVKLYGCEYADTVTVEEFKERWTGDVIAIENTQNKRVNNSNAYLLPLFLVLAFLTLQFQSFSFTYIFLSLLSLAGVLVSFFIIREETGLNNEAISKVCNSINKEGGCSSVINTSKSKLFGFVSLSDSAITFFSSQLLILLFFGLNTSFFFLLILSGIPFIIYSLYSQGFVLKQWCALCLFIIGIVILQITVVSASYILKQDTWDLMYMYKAVLLIVSIYFTVIYFKQNLIDYIRLQKMEISFLRFKRNLNIFNFSLNKKNVKDNTLLSVNEKISFGARSPVLQIDAFTNPLCGYCSGSFEVYYQLLKKYKDKININFIFSVPYEYPEDITTRISTSIIKIYKSEGQDIALKAMDEWFKEKKEIKWLEKWEKPFDLSIAKILKGHTEWSKVNNITYTPVTIINNYYFPQEYSITDLPYLIEDLIAEVEKIKEYSVTEIA